MEILTQEERTAIINQFVKNLEYTKYNLYVSLIAERAVDQPNQNNIDSFNSQLNDVNKKISALNAELAKVESGA